MVFTLGHTVQPQNLFVEAVHHPCYHVVAVQRHTPPESSLSTDIIVLEALLEEERDGVAAMNEVIFI